MLTKAVKKVESMLPKSPRKRLKVVKQLMYMTDHDSPDSHAKEGRPPLDPSVAKMVTELYEYDDNSRMSPGKGDILKVKWSVTDLPETTSFYYLGWTVSTVHRGSSRGCS